MTKSLYNIFKVIGFKFLKEFILLQLLVYLAPPFLYNISHPQLVFPVLSVNSMSFIFNASLNESLFKSPTTKNSSSFSSMSSFIKKSYKAFTTVKNSLLLSSFAELKYGCWFITEKKLLYLEA